MALPSERPAPAYAVRRLRVGEQSEHQGLFQFLRTAWGADSWHTDRARWDWQFREVPRGDDGEFPLLVFARGHEILGQLGIIPVRLSVGSTDHPAAFAFDIMVLRDYWNRGVFPLLIRDFCRAYPIAMGLGMNQKAYALFTTLGWIDIGGIPRLERYCAWRSLASGRTLVALLRQAGRSLRALLPIRARADLVVRSVPRFDERTTALWDRFVGERIGVRRTAPWLNWRYGEQPRLAYERLEVERDGRLVGCVVLRVEVVAAERVGYVVECFAEPALLDGVARSAVARLREQRVHRITCDVLDAATERALCRLGFVHRRSEMKFMIHTSDTALTAALGDRRRWYITRGDADQDRPR